MRSQLSESEESIGELRRAMGILEEQVSVERSAADGHRHVINELQLQVQRNNDLIESLKRNEEEMTEKLTSSLQQIAEKQDRIVGLESDLNELIKVKESLNVDFEALTASLRVAEREKAVISDELQKLEEARSHNEQLLQQEIARNQTLHEDSMKEQHKWEKVLSTKGDELTEVTSRCNELIRDREEAAQKLEHAASTKKHFIAALAILLALLLYFLLGSGTSPAAVPS
uniref:Uncharacterized protein n=1 Tax=Ciona savignyi TaxID=51511 RepID=H2YEG3_CIOSA